MNCSDIDKNFIILKQEKTLNPKYCVSDECSRRIIGGYCTCHLKVYNIRPHTFEIIGALRPFFEIIGISRLHLKEVEHIIDHLEKMLNDPITEKNKVTYKRVMDMRFNG